MIDEDVKGMLSASEARVLGCLMEKQMTTPEYYPLTLKALTTACNQKSSRLPVMNVSEGQVAGVVSGLRSRGLVTARMDGRADRFEHHLSRKLGLDSRQRAVLCVLMLRGLLTLNEIRINTGRMVEFADLDDIQAVLDEMMSREDPLLVRIPRAAGQREDRFAQLLCGEPEIEATAPARHGSPGVASGISERITRLEEDVAEMKRKLRQLCEPGGQRQDE